MVHQFELGFIDVWEEGERLLEGVGPGFLKGNDSGG